MRIPLNLFFHQANRRAATWLYIVFMIGIQAATIFITEILWYYFDFAQHNLVLLYVLSVLIISCTSPGYRYGFIAAIVSALSCDFLVVTPRLDFSFTIGSPITLITLLIVTMITSTLASRLREQKKLALSQQQHFELLYKINRELLSARSIDAIVRLINASLEAHVGRPVVFHTADPLANAAPVCMVQPDNPETKALFLNDAEFRRVRESFHRRDSAPTEPGQGGAYYLPVLSNTDVAGVIGIHCGSKPLSQDEMSYVHTLAGQVALALELQSLSDRQEKLMMDAEKEKIRSTLLRSISHDFRTPVATIRGASAAMREHPEMPLPTRDKLLRDIEDYAEWLIRMMENILTITRISGKELRIDKKGEAAEEVVAAAVSIIRKRYPDRHIQVQIPDSVMFVPMDATLISQVLINLLENAIKNSPVASRVAVRLRDQITMVSFDVLDDGCGIPAHLIDNLFKPYVPTRQRADISRGSGIGLSICKTIIDAHSGSITGYNKEGGGAVFSFSLPVGERLNAV